MPYTDADFKNLLDRVAALETKLVRQQSIITTYQTYFNQLYWFADEVTQFVNIELAGTQATTLSQLKTRLNLWRQQP